MKSHSLNDGQDIRHSEAYQLALLSSGTREDIIAWLVWNDRNGIYTDEDSELEDYPLLTLESARVLMRRVLDES